MRLRRQSGFRPVRACKRASRAADDSGPSRGVLPRQALSSQGDPHGFGGLRVATSGENMRREASRPENMVQEAEDFYLLR